MMVKFNQQPYRKISCSFYKLKSIFRGWALKIEANKILQRDFLLNQTVPAA